MNPRNPYCKKAGSLLFTPVLRGWLRICDGDCKSHPLSALSVSGVCGLNDERVVVVVEEEQVDDEALGDDDDDGDGDDDEKWVE